MRKLLTGLALLATVAAAPSLRVSVNDRPLDVAAVEEHARVLVPMRAIFEALGAQVQFTNSTKHIEAYNTEHRVGLAIGSRDARIDGTHVMLDVPARLIGNTTYVPIRFVSEALGAHVGYDNATRLVTISTPQHEATRSTRDVAVTQQQPAPNMRASTAYPAIGATLQMPYNAAISSLQMLIDGNDVSQYATYQGGTILFLPRTGLSLGTHTVTISGTTNTGYPFNSGWSFETTQPPSYVGPGIPLASQLHFSVVGGNPYYPGQWMTLQLIAPPGGTAYAFTCFSSERWYMTGAPNSSYYTVSVQVPQDIYPDSRCPMNAMYVAWNGNVTYLINPIFVWIAPPHGYVRPTPQPTPTYLHTQPIGRRTPAPPAPTPTPPLRRLPIEGVNTPTPTPVIPPRVIRPTPSTAPTSRPVHKRPIDDDNGEQTPHVRPTPGV